MFPLWFSRLSSLPLSSVLSPLQWCTVSHIWTQILVSWEKWHLLWASVSLPYLLKGNNDSYLLRVMKMSKGLTHSNCLITLHGNYLPLSDFVFHT
jgi:hypothetical protein